MARPERFRRGVTTACFRRAGTVQHVYDMLIKFTKNGAIHGCANCQSLLCLKSAVGIQAVYNELLHCVWATGLFIQLDNQAGSDIFT